MRKGRIENWQEINLLGGTRILGNVYESDAFEEGEEMFTSLIAKYHNVLGSLVVETTSGSMYHLGKPADKPQTLKEVFAKYSNGQNKQKIRDTNLN